MQNIKCVLADILNCGLGEIDMLLETEIDIGSIVQTITENNDSLNIESVYMTAFYEKVYDVFYYDRKAPEYHEDDFEIWYNGVLDTHIYIKNGKYNFYHENYPDEIKAIEEYMDMKFEEGI